MLDINKSRLRLCGGVRGLEMIFEGQKEILDCHSRGVLFIESTENIRGPRRRDMALIDRVTSDEENRSGTARVVTQSGLRQRERDGIVAKKPGV